MPENSPQFTRKNTKRTPRDIAKMVTTTIENRLLAFIRADAYAEPPPVEAGKKAPRSKLMTAEQVSAALGLLKKYKPDLRSVELKGDPDHPLVTQVTRVLIAKPQDRDGGSVLAAGEPESL
jgi:hypothetical protein